MNWDYSLFDAVQLMIPILCSFLTLLITLIYLFLYRNFRDRLYIAGFILSMAAFLFVLFESLVIVAGWLGELETGRVLHMVEHLIALYFLFTMMFFASALSKAEGRLSRTALFLAFTGLGIAVLISSIAIIRPELFISLRHPAVYDYVTPGDFARGQEGILYFFRDILLGVYLLFLISFSIISLISNRGELKNLLIVLATLWGALGAADDLMFFHFRKNIMLTAFRFSRFSVGLSFMTLIIMVALLIDYFKTQHHLGEAHENLKQTHSRLQISERKYRHLTEGVDQAVFSLSSSFHILSYNDRAREYFDLSSGRLALTLPDILVYEGNRERRSALSRQIVMANLRSLSRDRASVSFNAVMDDPRTGEPEELEFHIGYLETETGETEYICRAEKRRADRLLRSIDSESLQLTIDNYIIAIDHVTSRLTSALAKYLDSGTALMVKMGLQEILINAVEHGNLNISFEEKTKAIEENRYLDFIRERQQDPRYMNRSVRIAYKLSPDSVQYMITDEGEGFDISDTMKKVDDTVEQELLSHGRGIRMTRLLFDKVNYNSRGNQVLLVKNF